MKTLKIASDDDSNKQLLLKNLQMDLEHVEDRFHRLSLMIKQISRAENSNKIKQILDHEDTKLIENEIKNAKEIYLKASN